jgi:di/tricarboxylate transporter
MRVVPGGPVDGCSLEKADLRNLEGVYCVQINREHHVIAPVTPSEVLRGGDTLIFVGKVAEIVDLQRKRGLSSTETQHVVEPDDRHQAFFEVVVGPQSPLVGRTLKQLHFRDRYQAAVVAMHRAGRRVDEKFGQVEIQAGDTMLLLANRFFRDRWRDSQDFLLVAPLSGDAPARTRKAPIVGLLAAFLVFGAGAGLLPILEASLVVAFALVGLRVLTLGEARDAVDLNVIVLIAAAFGISNAMMETGLATTVASSFVTGLAPWGPLGALVAILLVTSLMTEAVTNNAAAALMFPIAVSTANLSGADPRAFAIAVAIAASASFLTPIGYQTNTIVYALGGYRFSDYIRLGLPLNITVLVTCVVVIPVVWPLNG